MSFTHQDVWNAIDCLAKEHGLSSSGLAVKAGLDATTFNKSKRLKDGRERWPSMESIAKILEATQTSYYQFTLLMRPRFSVRGEFRRAHNEYMYFTPERSFFSFAYVLTNQQMVFLEAARIKDRTVVDIFDPYVDHTGRPRIRGMALAEPPKPIFGF